VPAKAPIIVFLFPIILSAYAGGLVPGLFSTVLSTLASIYFILPPIRTWVVSSPVDNVKWISLCGAGTLISFLMARKEHQESKQLARLAGGLLHSAERRVQAGFAALLACLVAITAVSYPTLTRLREDTAWVTHTHQAIAALRLVVTDTTDAETAERGYMITGSTEYQGRYESAVQQVNLALDDVQRLTSDNRDQQRRLDWLRPLATDQLAVLKEGIELRKRSFASAQDLVLSRRALEDQDRIRGIVAEMEGAEQALLIARESLAQRSTTLARIEILGGSALAVVIVGAALLMIGQAFKASRSAEAALQGSRDELEIRVKERTSDLSAASEKLRTSGHRLAGIINSAMDAVITVDEQQCVELFNPAAERMFGIPASEVLGSPLERFIPYRLRAAHAEHVRLFGESEVSYKPMTERQEICGLRTDGSEFPIEASISHVQLGHKKVFTVILRDISERNRAEEALRRSEADLKEAQRIAQVGSWTWEVGPDIVTWSEEIYRIFGRDPNLPAPSVAESAELFTPESWERLRKAQEETIQGGTPYHVDLEVVRADGTRGWMVARGEVEHDSNDHVVRLRGTVQDITDRKRAEEALRRSEAKFRVIVETSHDGIVFYDAEGVIRYRSPTYRQISGFTDDERVGRSGFETVHPDDLAGVREIWTRVLADPDTPHKARYRILHKDGSWRWVETTFQNLLENPYVRAVVATAQDVTERQRAAEALEASELRFRRLFERSASALAEYEMIYDAQGNPCDFRFVNLNPAFERVTGLSASNILGRTALEATPDMADYWIKLFAQVLSTGEGTPFDHYASHLGRHYAGTAYSPRPNHAAVSFMDVTDRRRAEEALEQRAQELARSNADLAQFAYVASHDLKEPLRAVSGCVGLLNVYYEGKLDERSGEYMTHIVEGAARMETLISGLLAYSRVGTQGGELQPVESAKALGTALQNLAASVEENGAVVTHDALPAVNGDLPQLVSLFQNLIGNALKFRQKAPPRIHVSAERNGTHWRFSVRDNGIGIAPQYFERIFRVFQRLHTRREYPGTGIGLAICKKIVERHGGRIWLESLPGEGATFYFSLPAAHL
jgi:PAS domain S-box-containing protein